ncbi:hypothetical protein [Mesorhizobium sp.]|uniref:hypothetical protein n=1 Tax=Mesorhizobium sp. TaxID=1871066 RepID=UPI000FE814A0|nr:hypothetical protein [Mesorhizobium sp.]RWO82545.1 MAG: hypothetical protein EOQ95_27480 [Mesorhizobium sp.]RWQ54663.1 MAG: hypothetical protein EOS84_11945 [Mesorhizobium sp.]
MEFHDQQWKRKLERFAKEIAAISIEDDTDFFDAERPIFYSAFVVRKLIEDAAVTDALKGRSVDVIACPSSRGGREIFIEVAAGPMAAEENFDLTAGKKTRISIEDLTSEIIHCDGFVWDWSSPPPHAFLVFSYRHTLKRALYVTIDTFLKVLTSVLNDRPRHWWISKDLKTGKLTRHVAAKRPAGKVVVVPPDSEISAVFSKWIKDGKPGANSDPPP